MNRVAIAIPILGVTAIGCGLLTGPSDAWKLGGAWQWLGSCGGFTGTCITPAAGDTEVVVFVPAAFEPRGAYARYRNGLLVEYLPSRVESHGEGTMLVRYAGRLAQTARFAGRDSLRLADYASDGYDHRYVRAK